MVSKSFSRIFWNVFDYQVYSIASFALKTPAADSVMANYSIVKRLHCLHAFLHYLPILSRSDSGDMFCCFPNSSVMHSL